MIDNEGKETTTKKTANAFLEDFLTSSEETEMSFIETGNMLIDLGLTNGLGIPQGGYLLFYSPPSVGKSTLMLDCSARLIKRHKAIKVPYKVAYFDIEGSKGLLNTIRFSDDPDEKVSDFINSGDLLYRGGSLTYEYLGDFFKKLLSSKPPTRLKDIKFIVIDSISSVISATLLDNNCEKNNFGLNAKSRSVFLQQYVPQLEAKGITLVSICQVRDNQGAGLFDEKDRYAVTKADVHYASIISKLSKRVSDKEIKKVKVQTCFGEETITEKYILTLSTKGKTCKNRFFRLPDVSTLVHYGKNIHNWHILRRMLEGIGYIYKPTKKSNIYLLSDELPVKSAKEKLTLRELNVFVHENRGELISFLKERDQYKLVLSSQEVEDDNNDEYEDEED